MLRFRCEVVAVPNKPLYSSVVLAGLLFIAPSTFGGVLFGFRWDEQLGTPSDATTYFTFGYGPKHDDPGVLFGNAMRSTADAGRTFTADAGSPGWDQFVARITDGKDEYMTIGLDGPGHATNEGRFIYGHKGDPNFGGMLDPRIDLHGDTLTSVTMTVNSWNETVVANYGGNPFFTFYDINFTVTAHGSGPLIGNFTDFTPEPSSMALVILAGAAALGRK